MNILALIISYLLGSISFGYLVTKSLKGIDIRTVGSGSTGATNVGRVLGFKYAFLIFLLDTLKGLVVILLLSLLNYSDLFLLLCGIAVILGHNWPIYFKFKGGRGVATTLGVFLGIATIPALIVFGIFLVIVGITRYVSLGSIIAAICVPVFAVILNYPWEYFFFGVIIALIIVLRHTENIKRLSKGQEPKLGQKKREFQAER